MKNLWLTLLLVILLSSGARAAGAGNSGSSPAEGPIVWGFLERFDDHYIILQGGRRYDYVPHVIIDQGNTEKDPRGNIKITLDPAGKAKEIHFVGMDISEGFEKFKK